MLSSVYVLQRQKLPQSALMAAQRAYLLLNHEVHGRQDLCADPIRYAPVAEHVPTLRSSRKYPWGETESALRRRIEIYRAFDVRLT